MSQAMRTHQVRKGTGDTTRLDLLPVRGSDQPEGRLLGAAVIGFAVLVLFVLPAGIVVYRFASAPDAAPSSRGSEADPARSAETTAALVAGDRGLELLARGLPLDEPAPIEDPRFPPDPLNAPDATPGAGIAEEAPGGPPAGPVPPGPPGAEGRFRLPAPHEGHLPFRPGGLGHPPEEREAPAWEREIREKFNKRISFDFVDTPIPDVIAFLSNLTGTNFVLDPAAIQKGDLPVTLKVNDMRLGAALSWILKLVRLDYVLRDEAAFISTEERLREPTRIRVYDCRQLLDEAAQEDLLHVIFQVTGADWHHERALMRFVDGRLILRNTKSVMEKVEEFMEEFVRASARPAARKAAVRELPAKHDARMAEAARVRGLGELEEPAKRREAELEARAREKEAKPEREAGEKRGQERNPEPREF